MSGPSIKVLFAAPNAALPVYSTESAAGADLCAALDAPETIGVGQRVLIPTGLILEIPDGYEGQVRPRSGLALKHGVTVLNSPGTIDSDYRGEVRVILINLGQEPFVVTPGDRIAQLVIAPTERARFARADAISDTARAASGFGSTGI